MSFTSTKEYIEIGPCAYRNWKSDTDCYLLHGYDRSFKFVFGRVVLKLTDLLILPFTDFLGEQHVEFP